MKRSIFVVAFVALVFATVLMVTPVQSQTLINAFPNITIANPVDLQSPIDETNRIFVVSQQGRIFVFPNKRDASNPKTFLDLTDRVLYGGEQVLLGLVFHLNFIKNGYFYVKYTANNPRRPIISRF